MQALVTIPVQQAKPLQTAEGLQFVLAQTITASRRIDDVAADPRALMVVRQVMDNGVIQHPGHERRPAKLAKSVLPMGEFAFDLDVRADMPDELTPA